MRTFTIMIAAATVVGATPAQAATLGTLPIGLDSGVRGTLDTPGPQKWTLNLRRGGYYAVAAGGGPGSLSVHAAGGETLASVHMFSDEGVHGLSFKAPYTGSYTVQVACTPEGCPGRYDLVAGGDCPGDASTTCRIAVGQTLTGLSLFGPEDVDWRAVYLTAGRTYQVSTTPQGNPYFETCLAVIDPAGRQVAATCYYGSFGVAVAPAASGTYYVQVMQGEFGPGIYSLSVQ